MIRNLIASALTVSLLLGATAALAGDKKNYPGAACIGTDAVDRSGGRAMHKYLSWPLGLSCAAVKDTATSVRGHMHVIDQNGTEFVTCTMVTKSRTGGSLTLAKRCSGGDCSNAGNKSFSSPNPYHLDFNTSLSGPENSFVYFDCSIPPNTNTNTNGKSGVVSFEVDEL